MHRSSFDKMQAFRDGYLKTIGENGLTILDVGSAAPDGGDDGYRPLFSRPGWRYTGLDLRPGRNVDLVPAQPYNWEEIDDSSVDVVISGQAFEHIPWPWLTIMEIARVLKPLGLAAITAPSSGPVHRFPRDCWRFYPDGFPALAAYAGLVVLEQHCDTGYAYPENAFWGDVFIVMQRPVQSEAEAVAWRRRRAAAQEAVHGLDVVAAPGQSLGQQAIGSRSREAMSQLDPRRVKFALAIQSLRRIWTILRVPLADLTRP
jgi:SAM-dependent methyltransferase